MLEITRTPIVRVGVDLAKNVIQVHAVDAAGRKVVSKAIRRDCWCSAHSSIGASSTSTCTGATSKWLLALVERVGWQKACVAMANKNARVLWAMMTREVSFKPGHISDKPLAKCAKPPTAAKAEPCPA